MAHHKKEEHHKKFREGGRAIHNPGTKNKNGKSDTGVEHRASQNHDDLHKEDDYSGSGTPEVIKNALDRKDEYKRGGKVEGKKHKGHMGKHKFARGGRTGKPGANPFSSAYCKDVKGDAR